MGCACHATRLGQLQRLPQKISNPCDSAVTALLAQLARRGLVIAWRRKWNRPEIVQGWVTTLPGLAAAG